MSQDGYTPLRVTTDKVRAVTGTSDTPTLADAGATLIFSSADAVALTWPANATVAYPTNTVINIIQSGAGAVTITGAAGVTINGVATGSGAIDAQYKGFQMIKTATNTWLALGSVTIA